MEGDCVQLVREIPEGAVDLVLTDPPYGISLENHDTTGRTYRPTKQKSDYKIAGDSTQEVGAALLAWAEQHSLPVVVFASPKLPWPGQWRQQLVWDKGPAVGGGGDIETCWKFDWELVQIARTGKLNGKRESAVLRYHVTQLDFPLHSCQKPLPLISYLLKKTTQPGQLVLDPFAGSATTAVAAKNLGRHFLCIEVDPEHYRTGCARLATIEAQPALFAAPMEQMDLCR